MRDLGKLIVAKGFKKLPEVQKIAQSGHTGGNRDSRTLQTSSWCYKTYFGGNLDLPQIEKLNKVCSDVWTCTKMWKQWTLLLKQNYTLEMRSAFKMVYSCCFSLEKVLNINYWEVWTSWCSSQKKSIGWDLEPIWRRMWGTAHTIYNLRSMQDLLLLLVALQMSGTMTYCSLRPTVHMEHFT